MFNDAVVYCYIEVDNFAPLIQHMKYHERFFELFSGFEIRLMLPAKMKRLNVPQSVTEKFSNLIYGDFSRMDAMKFASHMELFSGKHRDAYVFVDFSLPNNRFGNKILRSINALRRDEVLLVDTNFYDLDEMVNAKQNHNFLFATNALGVFDDICSAGWMVRDIEQWVDEVGHEYRDIIECNWTFVIQKIIALNGYRCVKYKVADES